MLEDFKVHVVPNIVQITGHLELSGADLIGLLMELCTRGVVVRDDVLVSELITNQRELEERLSNPKHLLKIVGLPPENHVKKSSVYSLVSLHVV